MKKCRTRVLVAGVIGMAVVTIGMAVYGLWDAFGSPVMFDRSFAKVQPGMTETQVVALLGAANERTVKFRLGQLNGYEREYARAAASGSKHYLLWFKGIDLVYAVGFDPQDHVTIKAAGGT